MLLSDAQLEQQFGIDMSSLKPQVVSKLRDKAATYDDCMAVAKRLTFLVYSMRDAPQADPEVAWYLEALFGPIVPHSAPCLICLKPLSFKLFGMARRGKAEIETAHSNPRFHSAANVGFAHRTCNIAQGPLALEEFYDWMQDVLSRVRPRG